MGEKLKEYLKYFIGFAIICYFILTLVCKSNNFFDNLDISITITLFVSFLYIEYLWKYNPFEKTPKIYGKYEAIVSSTYDTKRRKIYITIKQNLISTRIYINTKESNSESISSDLIKKQDYWQLIYTYENIPDALERNHSEIHYGTCRLKIIDKFIVSGEYYTDRNTTGAIKKIKKLNN